MEPSEAPDEGQQIAGMGSFYLGLTLLLVLLAWFTSIGKKRQGTGVQSEKLRLPPGPKSWPIVGAIPYISDPIHESLQKLSKKYGPVMFMYLGSVPTLVVSSAAMTKEIFKTNDRVTASRPGFQAELRLFYDGKDLIFAPYGSHWRKARRICALKLFTTSRINQFQGRRQEEVDAMVRYVLTRSQNGSSIELEDALETLTMNITTRMLWNKSYRGSTGNEIWNITRGSNDVLGKNIGDFIPSLNWLSMHLSGLGRRIDAMRKRWDNFCEIIINERRQQRLTSSGRMAPAGDDADFLDVLLDLSMLPEEDPDHLTHFSVKALLADMIVAGTDTISITLHWALSFLLRYPHMMKKVQDEITARVGTDRLATEEDAFHLPYLDAVLRETLRLHPPFPMGLPHFSTADFQIDGFHVPSNTLIFANLWAVQRDPGTWERPSEFDPERFLGRGADDWWAGQKNFEMVPFGSGRRTCPGAHVASKVLHLAFAQMVHAIEWRLAGDQRAEDLDMAQKPGVQSRRAVPLRLVATPRLAEDVIFAQ